MTYTLQQIEQALKYVSPDQIEDFSGFFNFTAACISAGVSQYEWDAICRTAPGYNEAENLRHWNNTRADDGSSGVPGDYIVKLAYKNGFRISQSGQAYTTTQRSEKHDLDNNITTETLEFNDIIDEIETIEPNTYTQEEQTQEDRKQQFITWLTSVFDGDDIPNIHTRYAVRTNESGALKYIPADGGESTHTVKEIIQALEENTLENVFGIAEDNPAGVWIGVNPQSLNGTTKATVKSYDNVLLESDTMTIEEQISFLKATRLPIKTMTHSGGKSVHAIVSIGAKNEREYYARVKQLFKQLKAWGYDVDEANKNPNRLTRAAGFMRGEQCQTLIGTNYGLDNFEQWQEYIEDKLTEKIYGKIEVADNLENNDTEGAWLVKDVFHKNELVLMTGQSKAGKSLVTMQMALNIASGTPWQNHETTQAKVLYCNFEIAGVMASNRRNDIARALNLTAQDIKNFGLWNLAGRIEDVDDFIKRLTLKTKVMGAEVIIIDPIYILEGVAGIDENDASAVTGLINKLLNVKAQTGAAIILVHHISSKITNQAGYSLDALPQGSSTFSRIYDVLIALQELDIIDVPQHTREAEKAYRLSYSSRNTEPSDPDYVWGTYPSYSNKYNGLIRYCPLISSETYERKEKQRQEQLMRAIGMAQAPRAMAWEDSVR